MDPSVKCKYILTPCRTFGLQRTHKRTPGSKGSTPLEGNCSSLNAPFRSPLIADSNKLTPLAEKKSPVTPKPSWSTPFLPKSHVKMGLSKQSAKLHPCNGLQSKSLIQTDVGKSKSSKFDSNGSKKLDFSDKTTALGRSSHQQSSELLSPQAHNNGRFHSPNSNHGTLYNTKDDGNHNKNGNENHSKCDEHPAVEPLQPNITSSKFFDRVELSTLSPKKGRFVNDFSSSSDSDSEEKIIEDGLYKCSGVEAHTKLDNCSSPEAFHGWDLEKDQESLDCDSRKDLFAKCSRNFEIKLESSVSDQCGGPSESKVVPMKRYSQTKKLSFVKEKFRAKRRLMSDSEGSDGDANEGFSIQRKGSPEKNDRVDEGSSEKKKQTKIRHHMLASSESDDGDDARYAQKVGGKSIADGSPLGVEECNVVGIHEQPKTDSENENCFITNVDEGRLNDSPSYVVNKTQPRMPVISDADDDGNKIGLSNKQKTKRPRVSSSSSLVRNTKLGHRTKLIAGNESRRKGMTLVKTRLKKTRLLLDSDDDEDGDCSFNHIRTKSDDTCEPSITHSAPERDASSSGTNVKPGCDDDGNKTESAILAGFQSLPEKCALKSNSDPKLSVEMTESLTEFPSPSTQSAIMDILPKIDEDKSINGDPPFNLKVTTNGTELRPNKPLSDITILSGTVDDSFTERKPPEMQVPRTEGIFSTTSPKDDSHSSKIKLVVQLCRLPESALREVSGDRDTSDDEDEEFLMQKNFKTYGRTALRKKSVLKKPRILSSTRHPLETLVVKHLYALGERITLPSNNVNPDGDEEVKQRYLECISETEDFERMKNEMQKWLVGGQQVIYQIIEEVRQQREKDMSVMEVLQEHNIDPNLVGYDPAIEEFVSFDKFLLKNNLA